MIFRLLGDSALVICYGSSGDNIYNSDNLYSKIYHDYYTLRQKILPGIVDIILCYSSIGVYYNPEIITAEDIEVHIGTILGSSPGIPTESPVPVRIPVYYGGEFGPDLINVAEGTGLTQEEVITAHTGRIYTVWSIGFLPGFPYLGRLPSNLVLPRKPIPAAKVAAGSVAIAGHQTAIYPFDSPGGWHVIGRTLLKLFDLQHEKPCLLKPGDLVEFIPAVQ